MADEFQVCNENWWSLARSSAGFDGPGMTSVASSISCSSATGHIGGDGGYSWAAAEAVEGGTRSAGDEPVGSGSGSSVSYQDNHKVHVSDHPLPPCVSFMDSSVQVPGFGLSSPMIDWNQALISGGGGRVEPSFHAMLQDQDLSSRPVFRQGIPIESVQHQGSTDESSANLFKEMNQGFLLEQHQEQGGNFSLVPTSYGYNTPTMAQGLYEQENKSSQQQSLYQSPMSFGSNDLPQFLKSSSTPNKHPLSNQLHFSNNTPFWNASVGAATDVRPAFYSSMPTHFVQQAMEQKPSCNNLSIKKNTEAVSSGAKKSSSEPAFKKPRVETPSPLPTFKVRKEKLGDRITALQQLVSPFGKTDTASVLHEAIEYIKFLHEQVGVLSTPYLKNGNPMQHQQNNNEKHKDGEGTKQDLRSRGLCLVPIASTFPVASETPADFWTPTFGGMYR
ncbi:hypothetical protein J5N97_027194 [Dioscorea zingiberensis]|uniref:BHLH domain-containing protein n=1 Tax=Dioscorea zingiberensis TaxID=325984 RepID=A0A9D5C3J4_9LILI|nr:hypothetical protein J5N97_027194 [Dioscorea zingiberensis]